MNYQIDDSSKNFYSSCYDEFGQPTWNGNDEKKDEVMDGKIKINFQSKDTTIYMDTKLLKDSTKLWFWQIPTKKNKTTLVRGIKKNFITNTIDFDSTFLQYLGLESLNLMDTTFEAHKVKSWAAGMPKDIYDLRWYDANDMMIKELHYVGKDGVRIGVLTSILQP